MLCFKDYYSLIGASQMMVIINNANTSVTFYITLQVIKSIAAFSYFTNYYTHSYSAYFKDVQTRN